MFVHSFFLYHWIDIIPLFCCLKSERKSTALQLIFNFFYSTSHQTKICCCANFSVEIEFNYYSNSLYIYNIIHFEWVRDLMVSNRQYFIAYASNSFGLWQELLIWYHLKTVPSVFRLTFRRNCGTFSIATALCGI